MHSQIYTDDIEERVVVCVKAIKKKKFSKKQIIHSVALLIFKNNNFDFTQYTHIDRNIIEAAVLSQFVRLQRIGKLSFDHEKNKWVIIPNAEFPTIRMDYNGF